MDRFLEGVVAVFAVAFGSAVWVACVAWITLLPAIGLLWTLGWLK